MGRCESRGDRECKHFNYGYNMKSNGVAIGFREKWRDNNFIGGFWEELTELINTFQRRIPYY